MAKGGIVLSGKRITWPPVTGSGALAGGQAGIYPQEIDIALAFGQSPSSSIFIYTQHPPMSDPAPLDRHWWTYPNSQHPPVSVPLLPDRHWWT